MNKKISRRIVSAICAILVGGIGFFSGATLEKDSHVVERRTLLDSLDTTQAIVDDYEHTANYQAMFNYKAKEVTANCNKCGPRLTDIQSMLDSIKEVKGELVVPKYPGWSALE